jgi:hypothetical protein
MKSWLVEKPQPNRKMLQAMLVAVIASTVGPMAAIRHQQVSGVIRPWASG